MDNELRKFHEKCEEEDKKRNINKVMNNQKLQKINDMTIKTKHFYEIQKQKISENEKVL